MIDVGTVKELWQYPVKSMEGQKLDKGIILKTGLAGDRNWIVRDEEMGELCTVRKQPKLLKFSASYVQSSSSDRVSPVSITLPDGSRVNSSDKDVNQRLSKALGKGCSLWPLQPKSKLSHYRLKVPAGATAMKKQFATKELPDMSSVTWRMMMELAVFVTPLGRYHDLYPLHLLTTSSLAKLKEIEPEGDFRVERFRPNLLIDTTEGTGFEEFQWLDGVLHIGELKLKVVSRTVRCSMPAQPQASFHKDSKILKTIQAHTERHLGVNLEVLKPGEIKVGDRVMFEASTRSAIAKRFDLFSARIRNKAIQGAFKLIDRLSRKK